MSLATSPTQSTDDTDNAPIVLVSADTHIGPMLNEHLREYCPKKHLAEFDEYAANIDSVRESMLVPDRLIESELARAGVDNIETKGHYDMETRIADMNADGIAGEVIFHASLNGQPIPFRPMTGFFAPPQHEDPELAAVGTRIYNRWLADACSIEPERHAGLVQLPMWDIEASVKELEWGREAGLIGANFPAMRFDLPEYNDAVWEPLWSACEALQMPLTTHIGAGSPARFQGPEGLPLKMFEDGAIFGYRAIHWMVFGGVFERHPDLRLVITEIAGDWWPRYLASLDDVWNLTGRMPGLRDKVPHPPSYYCMKSVYYGASFMAHFEAEAALRDGYTDRMMWGSDYPHGEGTWQYGFVHDGETATRLALRNTFAGIPTETIRQLGGNTAIDVYGLDAEKLGRVAARIAAPTPADLATPPDKIPEGVSTLAFRTSGAWT